MERNVRFLLGKLHPVEREWMEEQLMTNDDAFGRMEVAEDLLLDPDKEQESAFRRVAA
jgi:hypothetical protein